MEYIKPEITFKKFYTESFLADEDVISSTSSDSEGDLEHGGYGTGAFDSNAFGGFGGWLNL